MSNLETARSVWETTQKVFDKIDDKEKKEGFRSLIDDIEQNDQIKKLKDTWDSMTEKQKRKLYKRDAITLWSFIRRGTPAFTVIDYTYHWVVNYKNNWWKNAAKYALLETLPCRFLVELGILKKPEDLTDEQLIKDVKKDAKNMNLYLWVAETACVVIPDAQAAVPFIQMLRHYTKWYEKHGTEVMIDKLNEEKKSAITEKTSNELAEVLQMDENEEKKAA